MLTTALDLIGTRMPVTDISENHPVTHHQPIRKKVIKFPEAPSPSAVFKNSFLKAIRVGAFEHVLPILPAWCLINKSCTFLYHNLVSVNWLSELVRRSMFLQVTTMTKNATSPCMARFCNSEQSETQRMGNMNLNDNLTCLSLLLGLLLR